MPARRQMLQSSMVVGIFAFLGSVTGILVEISIAAHLGLSRRSDTFYVAFTVPYILTNVLRATGQFSLVPFFSSLQAPGSLAETGPKFETVRLWHGFSYATNMVFLGMAGFSALGALTSPWLVRGIAPGFTPHETAMAIQLCRWLFLILAPAGVAEVIRSFLFSQRRFAVAASGNFFRNAIVIAFVLFGFRRFGFYSIVLGYIAGQLIQLAIFAIHLLISFPVRYSLALKGSGEAFRNLRGASAAQLTSALGRQALVVVERIIASFLPPGTLTALGYGLKIMATLSELLAGSVSTAALPVMSAAFAREEWDEVRRALRHAFEIVLLLIAPATVFCLMLSPNIIRLIFERGNFTPQATALMARVLYCYSFGLVLYAAIRILNSYLFAVNQAMAFLRLTLLQYGLNVALDLLFVGEFRWVTAGIPLALVASLAVMCVIAFARDVGRLRQTLNRTLGVYSFKILTASGVAAALVWAFQTRISAPRGGMGNFLFLCEACGTGTLVFFMALTALRAVRFSQIASLWSRSEDA